jgi:putative exporter of polyketide antibiotics
MRVRGMLVATAIVSSFLGAVAVYLALTVPNDLKADAMLKQARTSLAAKQNDRARTTLLKIVQQYPRTDAAAAATVALVTLANEERHQVAEDVQALRRVVETQQKALLSIGAKVDAAAVAAATAPPPPTVSAAPAVKPVHKKAPVKRTKRRRRRR